MEDVTISDPSPRPTAVHAGARWKDLREWLALVEEHRSLLRITGEVDPNEELSAITFMATRNRVSPALLFDKFPNNPLNARVLSNMLGASKQRYALAVGLDPESLDPGDGGGDAPDHQEANSPGLDPARGRAGQRGRAARKRDRFDAPAGADVLAG